LAPARNKSFTSQVAGRKRTFTLKDLAHEIDGVKASASAFLDVWKVSFFFTQKKVF